MSRFLLVHPGATWAVHDVHTGLLAGLQAGGHEVYEYALDRRIEAGMSWLKHLWQLQVDAPDGGPLADQPPNEADAIYHAGQEAVTRALRFEVDWVLVVCAAYFHPNCAILARRAGLRLAVVFTESPYDDDKQATVAPLYDVCFTQERASVPGLRAANPNTHYLPAAYDPAHHGPHLNGSAPAHDVVFVGSGYESRTALLSAVDWGGIDLGLYGAWDDLAPNHPLRRHVRGGVVDNARAGALYRKARIALNLYRSAGGVPAESLNPRAYELAADGVLTVSHPRAEVGERFGLRVPVFRTAAELGRVVRHYLAHPDERDSLGADLPPLVAEDTYTHRAAQLVAHLCE